MIRLKFLCIVLAGAVAGLCLADVARAGNEVQPGALYYDVELLPGQYFYSTLGRQILVDDVTFASLHEPCPQVATCEILQPGDFPFWGGVQPQQGFLVPGNMGVLPPPPGSSGGGGGGGVIMVGSQFSFIVTPAYVNSKAAYLDMRLDDSDGQGTERTIDRFTVSYYAQIAHQLTGMQVWDMSSPEREGGGGIAFSEVMPTIGMAATTSGSRHYQSPHIVQNGRVYLVSSQSSASYAIVKGRTLSAGTVPQAQSITIVTPQ